MPKPTKAKPKKDRKLNVDLLCKMAGKETEREVPLPDGTKLEARTANLRRAKVAILLCPPLPPNGNCYAPEVGCLQAALALYWLLHGAVQFLGESARVRGPHTSGARSANVRM